MQAESKRAEVSCPRCGYDLAGEVARWRGSCPIEGCCSECGLTYRWGDLYGRRILPRWFVESSGGVLGGFRRFPGTLLRILVPTIFWQRIQIEACPHPIRLRPYLGWIVGMFLVAYLGAGLVVGSRAAITAHDMCTKDSVWRTLNAVQKPYLSKPTKETPSQVAGKAFVSGVVDPFGVSKGAGVTAWAWLQTPVIGYWRGYRAQPFWWVSLGPNRYYTGMRPKAPSRGLIFVGVVTVAMPLVFLVLPVTRKRAKVRGGHILRLFLLSLMAPFVTWILYCFAWGSEMDLYLVEYANVVYGLGALISIILLLVWWGRGCRDFLRLTSWPAVFASIALIGLLAGAVSMVVADYGIEYFGYIFS